MGGVFLPYSDFGGKNMKHQNTIAFLLENAPPNILYRVQKEIFHEPSDSSAMLELQAQILKLPKRKRLARQWLCRCGLAPYIPELQSEVNIIANAIDENGICKAPLTRTN